ncbi:hypothetical protein MLD38_032884 [Melastoma candidum]|uniref:Uncharacterized protein n=1 Tax=Melastoma candidum TaxID=119954 RepID=A0ACB9M8N9_9MYRT|nr:hypothetical protein MLD38_032884 [Melastoma candidum]
MADPNKIHPTERVAEVLPILPKQPPSRSRSSSCCCRFICATIGILLFLLIVVAAAAGVLYLVFKPKIPQYSVDSLQISDLRLNLDMSLYARFDVKVTATNPNEHVGIHYEKGGQISVWYQKDMLCAGKIPTFYQGHRNVTKLDVVLTGDHESGSTILTALQQQQQSGGIPLNLKVSAPVAIQLGGFKTMKVKVRGDCSLVVDSLSTNSLVSIQSSSCRFGLKL